MDAVSKEIIGDTLADIKFSGISWQSNEGFYYSRYDKPEGNVLFATVALPQLHEDACYDLEPPKRGTASRSSKAAQLSRQLYELLWGDVLGALAPRRRS